MPGQVAGAERELDEDDVEEEVEEDDREGTVVTELNAQSSSSVSISTEDSHEGTGVQGCQPGATEQDFTSWGLRSLKF